MKKRTALAGLLLSSLFFAACGARGAGSPRTSAFLQIKGSDTMVNLGQAWAEEFNKIHPDVNVAVTGGGSGTGIAALINGTCDIAESSRAVEEKEVKQAAANGIVFNQETVALDGIVVVVHPSNPVQSLTMDQLREMFLGNVKRWKVFGGADIPIVLLSREVNSGTHIFFKEHVLRRGAKKAAEEFSPGALMMPSSFAIAEEAAHNENAVGYYGLGYISPRQKVIAVAKDDRSPFIAPNVESVRTGAYPISRPLYLYTNGKPAGLVKDFIDFVYSKEGQDLVARTDFVPIK